MTRLVLPLSLAALLAACAEEPISPPVRSTVTSQPVVVAPSATAPAVVTAPAPVAAAPATIIVQPNAAPYRAGSGLVESIQTIARPNPAAAGGPAAHGIYRLSVRMDDGAVQVIDQDSRAYNAGDRITITTDGHVTRP